MATRNFGNATQQMGRGTSTGYGSGSGSGTSAMKTRQLTHLNSQLARLSANLADTENLMTMTAAQAEAMRGLGSWHAGL
ncbi:uncharacterized protein DNG_02859 [Cephalotrichum gorgonifer]|uniref:Uncharacterized protein n=1 Tax=Cephalotrichum gorgonifer TaxID=2041049 RepID=A0AAE8MU89_9PEZI|nr:uncharacterized protein DNG_02859 [Cephalotrichum gorgonifer]